ncbi:GNAT family N-acetyltransferase [Nocardiopsis ansamitocini]|uniref:N-acetyltransferase n=1 Tax=Nocardiopsis ansamitocini TaxID=1670832 RepID=A0A9W6UKG2_9ACTN|nr:N-acetyltransferase [Nocardiopsis ansamitocini]GLU49025.1 N-acetyltransferase [Nocardiopsis ansamitocini]
MLIRRETPADIDAIRSVTTKAFSAPGQEPPREAPLVDELRVHASWLPLLSHVAIHDDQVVGHVVCTRGKIGGAPVLGLGPISVLPEHQRSGVGSALMHSVIGAADALGETLVGLLGDPAYYARFGFVPAEKHGVVAPVPEWSPYFQVRPLAAHFPGLHGTFAFPEPFDRV